MTAQDTFPKIAGDIIYHSELNRYAGGGRFLGIGSSATIGSQAGATICGIGLVALAGSLIVNSGSVGNPCEITVDLRGTKNPNAHYFVGLSGLGGNTGIIAGSAAINGTSARYHTILGSPLTGMARLQVWNMADDATQNSLNPGTWQSFNSVDNFNVGSNFVIFLGFSTNQGNSKLDSYSIQSFRGGF